jgi:hypothetical protein
VKHPLAKRYIAALYRNRPDKLNPGHNEADFWRGVERVFAEGHFTPQEIMLLLRHRLFHTILGLAWMGRGDRAVRGPEGLDRLHAMLDDLYAEGLAA